MSSREHTKALPNIARARDWRCAAAASALGALLLTSGCATAPKNMPTEQFTRTEDAIKDSIEHGAREKAAAELVTAEDHFQKAKNAAENKDYAIALLYAEKAEADAQLAEARADRAGAAANLKEVEQGIRILKEEVDRQLDERSEDSLDEERDQHLDELGDGQS